MAYVGRLRFDDDRAVFPVPAIHAIGSLGAVHNLRSNLARLYAKVGEWVQAVGRLHRLIRELVPGGIERDPTATKASALVGELSPVGEAEVMRVELALDYIEDIEVLDARSTLRQRRSRPWSRRRRRR